jgi:hypothetical protein
MNNPTSTPTRAWDTQGRTVIAAPYLQSAEATDGCCPIAESTNPRKDGLTAEKTEGRGCGQFKRYSLSVRLETSGRKETYAETREICTTDKPP